MAALPLPAAGMPQLLLLAGAVLLVPCASGGLIDQVVSEEYRDIWALNLLLNVFGYGTVILPGYLIIRHLQRVNCNETLGHSLRDKIVRACVFGNAVTAAESAEGGESGGVALKVGLADKQERSFRTKAALLLFCFLGLQVSYLTWGVLQERIMTHEYRRSDEPPTSPGTKFNNTQYLVFLNRILSLLVAGIWIKLTHQPRHTAALYKYSFCSMSNIMSSWFQYEALKFVSFPVQLLCKASKVIPTMLMGRLISKRQHELYEYGTAALLSSGIAIFLFSYHSHDELHGSRSSATVTTFSGLLLMTGYLMFDSYTSNWQEELFKQHRMTSMQMMAGVNIFSCLLTFISLIEQGSLGDCFAFSLQYPLFTFHASMQAVASTVGQLFIYYTIYEFGAVAFATIMTIRMALAILLSCVIYKHFIGPFGYLGLLVVFAALFLQIYIRKRKGAKPRPQKSPTATADAAS